MSDYKLSKRGYYADFVLIPAGMSAALVYLFMHYRVPPEVFASSVMVGVIVWTLAEYLIHRFIFHKIEPIKRQHRQHHIRPADYIGASSFTTFIIFAALLIGSIYTLRPVIGVGLVVGIAAGYYAYIAMHDCFHHSETLRSGSIIWKLYQNHKWHHGRVRANFGVTSPIWDIVFGTYSAPVTRNLKRK